MKIAFDVKGTIDGPKGSTILLLLRKLKARGHEVIVWSNLYSYATEAVAKHGLDVEVTSKTEKSSVDYNEAHYVDVAIDDDSRQTWLAAKNFIWVHDISESQNLDELVLKIEQMNNNKPEEVL